MIPKPSMLMNTTAISDAAANRGAVDGASGDGGWAGSAGDM